MTADDVYTIAGHGGGTAGHSGDGGSRADAAFLNEPVSLANGSATADLYIADAGNNRIQEIPATAGTQWGQSMTADDIYTVAGSSAGTAGRTRQRRRGDQRRCWTSPEGVDAQLGAATCTSPTPATTGSRRSPAGGGTQWGIIDDRQRHLHRRRARQRAPRARPATAARRPARCLNGPDVGGRSTTATSCTSPTRRTTGSRRSPDQPHRVGHPMTANDIYTIAGSHRDAPGSPATAAPRPRRC